MKKKSILKSAKRLFASKILSGESSIYIHGERELSVYTCKGIDQYNENLIVLKTVDGTIMIYGRSLMLKTFSTGEIRINGEIETIKLEKGTDKW